MRALRIIFALYVLVWFNVVVPAHQRGVIRMAGASSAIDRHVAPCCAESKGKPTPSEQKQCAICYVACIYLPLIVHTIDLQITARVEGVQSPATAQVLSLDYPAPYWPVGPPVSA